MLTGVLGLAAILGAIYARGAYLQAKQQAAAAWVQADYAEKSLTNNRAVIFVEPSLGIGGIKIDKRFELPYRFDLKNYGATPAIVTGLVVHLYVASMFGGKEPDPLDPRGMETSSFPLQIEGVGAWFQSEGAIPINTVIPANGTMHIRKDFVFDPRPGSDIYDFWFLAIVCYKDIYGFTDETGFFGSVSNMSESTVSPEHERYNYWKQPGQSHGSTSCPEVLPSPGSRGPHSPTPRNDRG